MLIFAHRGASGYAPENSLSAMASALSLQADGIELDVHNVEGELLVFHDRHIETVGGQRQLIHRQRLTDLAAIRIHGEAIPSLWQVLELVSGRCIVNIELKGIRTAGPMQQFYRRAITELGYRTEQLLVSSFNHPELAMFKAGVPEARVAPLLASLPLDGAEVASRLEAYALHLDVNFISQAIVDDAHERGINVNVYTVDDADDIRALAAMGVDGVFANFPDLARQALSQQSNKDYRGWFE